MTTNYKVNPLNVFKARRTEFPPSHFEYTDIPLQYNLQEALIKWIDKNCKSRYYIGKNVFLDNDNKIQTGLKVGFEESKEMSFFMLACPHLKYK